MVGLAKSGRTVAALRRLIFCRPLTDKRDMNEQRLMWAAACVEATRLLETASDDPENSIFLSLTQREVYLVSSLLLMSLANGLPDAGATKLLDKIRECLGVQGFDVHA
jgi:hypothetical protein